MNAEAAITISNIYREAKSQFEMSKPAKEYEQLEEVVMQRFSALTNGQPVYFESFEIAGNTIIIDITDRQEDKGTYILDLETFLHEDIDAIKENEKSIRKSVEIKNDLIRALHTREFIKMRDAIKALNESPLECKPEIPEWYETSIKDINRLNNEIETLNQSKKINFSWS
tara:strand:- start:1308 stop:1817 length:510 start_codon:yes stop_codon:yes gene_type:complete